MKRLILASESPGRQKILKDAGYEFEVIPGTYEEDMTLPMPPHELAIHLSRGKAHSVVEMIKANKLDAKPDAIIIAADTFGVYDNHILGKPHTPENALRMLTMLSGRTHSMVTGLTVINISTGKELNRSVESKIVFKEISADEISEYIKLGESLKKAGGYMYQGVGRKFVQSIEGSETNIMGLPIEALGEVLTRAMS